MKKKIVKIEPYFEPRIWGGEKMLKMFHYDTAIFPVGEVYNVVALKDHADCKVVNEDMTLSQLYEMHADWFQCDTNELPIRVNLLYPEADLSIQVHPDDAFAREYNGGRGKPEAWVILDAPNDGYIAFGHRANTKEEFIALCKDKRFTKLVKYLPTRIDHYIDIPCGTLHAIGKGVLTYNISRNADCTLRLYDYERIDPTTNRQRDLQINEVIENVNIPDTSKDFIRFTSQMMNGCHIVAYCDEPGLFALKRIKVDQEGTYLFERFAFYTVVDGEGSVNGISIRKGETFLVPAQFGSLLFKGNLDMFLASYHNKEVDDESAGE